MPRGVPNVKPDEAEVTESVEAESVEAEPVEADEESGVESVEPEAEVAPGRHEVFEATRPDGTVVIVDRNIDTGEQTVAAK